MKSGVYKIENTSNGKIYVGRSVDLMHRKSVHWHHLRKGTHHSVKLQMAWLKHGESAFIFHVIERVVPELLTEREQYWFDLLMPQYNIIKDARGAFGYKLSAATKAKIAAKARGRRASDETKMKLSDIRKGWKHSDETKRKMRQAGLGRTASDVTRAKISASCTGRKMSAESVEKTASQNRGRKQSTAHVSARVAAHVGAKRSPEARLRMSIAQKERFQKNPLPREPGNNKFTKNL